MDQESAGRQDCKRSHRRPQNVASQPHCPPSNYLIDTDVDNKIRSLHTVHTTAHVAAVPVTARHITRKRHVCTCVALAL
jgi:hypothetical protein